MPLPDFLINRYKDWKHNSYPKKENSYKSLEKEGQKPKAIIISCCDSRVDPSIIFKAEEGDFFIHRNIANLVPATKQNNLFSETLSALEYGIKTLNISNIIILGHSCCGGIEYGYKIFSGEISDNETNLSKWVENIRPAYALLDKSLSNKKKYEKLEKLSIENSILNLTNIPFIKKSLLDNKLLIHGIWFELNTGKLMYFNQKTKKFEDLIY